MKRSLSYIFCMVLMTGSGSAEESLASELRLNGDETRKVFEPQRQTIQDSTAVFYIKHESCSYGTIMTSDGYVLTKASEVVRVFENLTIRIGDKKFEKGDFTFIAADDKCDLALIKVHAEGLIPAEWLQGEALELGTWVVVNGVTSRRERRIVPGVISATSREIKGLGPDTFGMEIVLTKNGLKVTEVIPDSEAAKAKMKVGDLIIKMDGEEVKFANDVRDALRSKEPKSSLNITVSRDGKEETLKVAVPDYDIKLVQTLARNDSMSGRFSKRRDGFSKVLQHDARLNRARCGGPLILLSGKSVGINIARANRAESFAIPSAVVLSVFEKLKKYDVE